MNIVEWSNNQQELLGLEREAERQELAEKLSALSAQECQEIGISLLSMDIESVSTSLYGRTKYCIQRKDKKQIPNHSFKVGDEAELYVVKFRHTPQAESTQVSGIISKVSSLFVEMICEDQDANELSPPLRLDKRASEATYKKMVNSLAELHNPTKSTAWPLIDVLFNNAILDTPESIEMTPYSQSLNSSQIDAIQHCLGSERLALIHGPPGTGKTTAVTEFILQSVARGLKVLVCAPSNVAIDNIIERLEGYSPSSSTSTASNGYIGRALHLIRLGHPARISESVLKHCLDSLVLNHEGTELVLDARLDIDKVRKDMVKNSTSSRFDKSKNRELRDEMKMLRKEVRKREDEVITEIMKSRNVVCSTCVGASSKLLRDIEFDVVVIDEAAQALEAACWVPILLGKKVILAGDHCQLPPTIKSKQAEQKGLGVTLFERIINSPTLGICARMLDTQYRMHQDISNWSSAEMYNNKLISHPSNTSHTLRDISSMNVDDTSRISLPGDIENLSSTVLLLLDTTGCHMEEQFCRGGSWSNKQEALLVAAHVQRLYSIGLGPRDIGIITPYNGQLEILREIFFDDANDAKTTGFKEDSNENKTSAENSITGSKSKVEDADVLQYRMMNNRGLEIRTVDGFQGGEKEAIILSFVRSNGNREVGFLSEKRRINVAVTRAKRHLAVVCDVDTCSSDDFIGRLLNHISTYGEHRSALEFMDVKETLYSEIVDKCSFPEVVSTATSLPLPTASSATAQNRPTESGKSNIDTQNSKMNKKNEKQTMKKQNSGKSDLSGPLKSNNKQAPEAKLDPLEQQFIAHFSRILHLFCTRKLYSGVFGSSAIRHITVMKTPLNVKPKENAEKFTDEQWIASYSTFLNPLKTSGGEDYPQTEQLLFPSTLNPFQRMKIHEIADKINLTCKVDRGDGSYSSLIQLTHQSIGEGTDRHLVVIACFRADDETVNSLESKEVLSETAVSPLIETKNQNSLAALSVSEDEDDDDEQDHDGDGDDDGPEHVENSIDVGQTTSSSSEVAQESINPLAIQYAKKKDPKVSNKSSIAKITTITDDDLLLDSLIQENKETANYKKYRVSATAMPNMDRKKKVEALSSIISQAASQREVKRPTDGDGAPSRSQSGTRTKKVLKKPPSNFKK